MQLVQLRHRADHVAGLSPFFFSWRHILQGSIVSKKKQKRPKFKFEFPVPNFLFLLPRTTIKGSRKNSLSHPRLGEQILPWISGRDALELLHQISHAFIRRRGHDHLNLHVLVASSAIPRARHAFFLQPQRLPAVRPRWDSNDRPSVDGRQLYLL